VSPKSGAKLVVRKGDELKLVVPQLWPYDLPPTEFRRYSVQPMAVPDPQRSAANILAAIEWVRSHPSWYLGVQLHKMLGLP
jgi:organic radical activating enzyme